MRIASLSLFLAFLVAGCDPVAGPSKDSSDTDVVEDDVDGDGWTAAEGDCDENDASVNPGGQEICDGIDNDCDGAIDQGVTTTFYLDGDGDGFGDATVSQAACTRPDGFVPNTSDCDDADPEAWPGNVETCDGIDNDCDGDVDEEVARTFYADADGDGFGNPDSTLYACDQPKGYVFVDGDCDDTDAASNPAAVEICDELDNDCDGTVDEGLQTLYYADRDEDGHGSASLTRLACSLPVGYATNDDDCDDDDPIVFPGSDELCNGWDDNCDGLVDEDSALDAPTWYRDRDQDGYGDATAPQRSCTLPAGHADNSLDCNDVDAAISPSGVETCDGVDNNCDGQVDEGVKATWHVDADADGFGNPAYSFDACVQPAGYVLNDQDCNDLSTSSHPGALELCDGLDNDCDGAADEDGAVDGLPWYRDTDGDTFGDASQIRLACQAPWGFVADDTDCDDAVASTRPGADEWCNGNDDDCDGIIDEPDALDTSTWYVDADSDTHGNPLGPLEACDQPAGHVPSNDDCNDASADVFPGASERCNSQDDDCDGFSDEDPAIGAPSWYRDADGDGAGDPNTIVETCYNPVGYLASATDCDDSDANTHPGAAEWCDGHDDDCDGVTDESDAVDSRTWYGDADADGYGTVTVSLRACYVPTGYRSSSTDCNDAVASVNPGATESCNLVDDDCDGTVDDGVLGTGASCRAQDCSAIQDVSPSAPSGTYHLNAGSYYCDQVTGGGGWTRIADNLSLWGTGYDGTWYNAAGFAWNEVLFKYDSGSVHAHSDYPAGIPGVNNIGFQFGAEYWGVALNWGSSLCGMAYTTAYIATTTYIGGYDFKVGRTLSTNAIRVGTLEGVASCTTSDNPGTAYLDLMVRR